MAPLLPTSTYPGSMTDLFSFRPRNDRAPMRPNESTFRFLDRSASRRSEEVRRLLNEWVAGLPEAGRPDLIPRLRSTDQDTFEAAFWELYLYTTYSRSGYRLTDHPDVPNSPNHPDFKVDGNGTVFYLEAVRPGATAPDTAAGRRLDDVAAALGRVRAEQRFMVGLSFYEVGPNALPTTALRLRLTTWLGELDPDSVAAEVAAGSLFDDAPRLPWSHEGWELEFLAIPLRAKAKGNELSLVGMVGPGRAQWVNNLEGLRRVLAYKANNYGVLDHPLVIAVMSNAEFRTDDFEQALFGRAVGRREDSIRDPRLVVEGGHWLTSRGWRNGHAPQVIAASALNPWSITQIHPRLWTTLEPEVVVPSQPDWLSRVYIVGNQAADASLHALFGLPPGWSESES